jgi:hypothetical protein
MGALEDLVRGVVVYRVSGIEFVWQVATLRDGPLKFLVGPSGLCLFQRHNKFQNQTQSLSLPIIQLHTESSAISIYLSLWIILVPNKAFQVSYA